MHESARSRQHRDLPKALLYAIGAGIGGSGLDAVALESLKASYSGGFLGHAVALSNNQSVVPAGRITSLQLHPVKTLSFLPKKYYIGAKKHAVDARAAAMLRRGGFDFFHGWSGDSLFSLREAARLGIPSLLEVPTWHRNKGKVKPDLTQSERERDAAGFPHSILNTLLVTRQQAMEEYRLATRILVLSEKARETFLVAGLPPKKLFPIHRGVDPDKFSPAGAPPEKFRAVFVGALVRRKGIPMLIEAWRQAALADSELVLVGAPQPEVEAELRAAPSNVHVSGHVRDVASELRRAAIHVFPSELEGSAKATYEAAACGLPQITTREAGDVVVDGKTGWVIPANDPEALISALRSAHADRSRLLEMGKAARQRILHHFTWDHFRERLLLAYREAMAA